MEKHFNQWLDKQKFIGNYTTKYDLNENLLHNFGNKIDNWLNSSQVIDYVDFDFSDKKVRDLIIQDFINKLDNGNDKYNTNKKIYEKIEDNIINYIKELIKLAQFGDKERLHFIFYDIHGNHIRLYFEKSKPFGAKAFLEMLSNADNEIINRLADISDIDSEELSASKIRSAQKAGRIAVSKNKRKMTINIPDSFINDIKEEFGSNIKEQINNHLHKFKYGKKIKVYSISYKIDNSLISEAKENSSDLNACYTYIIKEIDDKIESMQNYLNNGSGNGKAGNIEESIFINENDDASENTIPNDYLGLVPVKTYGFNLYFRDKDSAEQAGEFLNESEDFTVSTKERYSKKILGWPKLLKEKTQNGNDWFSKLTFTRTVINDQIKDKFPGANTIQAYKFTVPYNDAIGNHIIQVMSENANTVDELNTQIKKFFNNLNTELNNINSEKSYITGLSEKNALSFLFTSDATPDVVITKLAASLYCDANAITFKKINITNQEITQFQNKKSDTSNYQSVIEFIFEQLKNTDIMKNNVVLYGVTATFNDNIQNEIDKIAADTTINKNNIIRKFEETSLWTSVTKLWEYLFTDNTNTIKHLLVGSDRIKIYSDSEEKANVIRDFITTSYNSTFTVDTNFDVQAFNKDACRSFNTQTIDTLKISFSNAIIGKQNINKDDEIEKKMFSFIDISNYNIKKLVDFLNSISSIPTTESKTIFNFKNYLSNYLMESINIITERTVDKITNDINIFNNALKIAKKSKNMEVVQRINNKLSTLKNELQEATGSSTNSTKKSENTNSSSQNTTSIANIIDILKTPSYQKQSLGKINNDNVDIKINDILQYIVNALTTMFKTASNFDETRDTVTLNTNINMITISYHKNNSALANIVKKFSTAYNTLIEN